MIDILGDELTRNELKLSKLQRELVNWERDGATEETRMAQAFIESLKEHIVHLRCEIAVAGRQVGNIPKENEARRRVEAA